MGVKKLFDKLPGSKARFEEAYKSQRAGGDKPPAKRGKPAPPDWGEVPKDRQSFGGRRVTRVIDTDTGKPVPKRKG